MRSLEHLCITERPLVCPNFCIKPFNSWLKGCRDWDIPEEQRQYPGNWCPGNHADLLDYKNPLHLDVVDRYLRRMEEKRFQTRRSLVWNRFISRESQVLIYHCHEWGNNDPRLGEASSGIVLSSWVAGINLPQSRCWGFFVSSSDKKGIFT